MQIVRENSVPARLKRLQTHPIIDRKTALENINVPLYAAYRQKQDCLIKASSNPLPGPALDAFVGKAIDVAGVKVSRLLPAHIMALEILNSKLLGLFSDAKEDREKATKLSTKEQMEICFIFTTEDIDGLLALAEQGQEATRKAAVAAIKTWEFPVVENVVLAAIEQIVRGFQGKVKLLSDLKEGGQLPTFFPATGNSLTTNTASAGS